MLNDMIGSGSFGHVRKATLIQDKKSPSDAKKKKRGSVKNEENEQNDEEDPDAIVRAVKIIERDDQDGDTVYE